MTDDELLDEFTHRITSDGIVASVEPDGVIIGITKEKLQELMDIATKHPDGRALIFIHKQTETTDCLN
jgi:hypothetical protein